MTVNLLDLARTALGSEGMGQIAGLLGESESKTKSALDMAGSAILGSLMQKASSPQGAQDVLKQVNGFDTSLLDGLGGMLSGGKSSEQATNWMSIGASLLSGLMGSKESSLIESLGRLSGIGQGSAKSLLGMLAPLLLGLIAKRVKSGNLGLSGLTDLLMGQKANVAKHLPADLSRQMGIANLLDTASEGARNTGAAVTRATRETAEAGNGLFKTLVPLAIAIGLGLLAWRMFFSEPAKEVAQNNNPPAVAPTIPDTVELQKPSIPMIDVDAVSSKLDLSFTEVTKAVAGITDEASAREVVPQIEQLQTLVSGYGFDKLPAEETSKIGAVLSPMIDSLQAALEVAYKIPGVKEIIEPTATALIENVAAFAK